MMTLIVVNKPYEYKLHEPKQYQGIPTIYILYKNGAFV